MLATQLKVWSFCLSYLKSNKNAPHLQRYISTIISWQGIVDALQTAALKKTEDNKLKTLASLFNLDGERINGRFPNTAGGLV